MFLLFLSLSHIFYFIKDIFKNWINVTTMTYYSSNKITKDYKFCKLYPKTKKI